MYCLCKVSHVVRTRVNKIFLLVQDLPSVLLQRLANLGEERQSARAPTLSGRNEWCGNGGDRDGGCIEGGNSARLAIWHYLGWNKRPLVQHIRTVVQWGQSKQRRDGNWKHIEGCDSTRLTIWYHCGRKSW